MQRKFVLDATQYDVGHKNAQIGAQYGRQQSEFQSKYVAGRYDQYQVAHGDWKADHDVQQQEDNEHAP